MNTTPPEKLKIPSTPRELVLLLLLAINTICWIDRSLIVVLAEPIKNEFSLSDTQMGLLMGAAFTLFFFIASIPLARLADRYNRSQLIALLLAFWSTFTAFTGLATSFLHLFIARLFVATGEAGCAPASISLLSDYFDVKRRASAISIVVLGGPLGVIIALVMGSLIGQLFGWRMAFYLAGVVGIVLMLLVRFILQEPPRGHSDPDITQTEIFSLKSSLLTLWRCKTYRWLVFGYSFLQFSLTGITSFNPTFFMRAFDIELANVGTWLGVAAIFGSLPGTLLGGILADQAVRRTHNLRYNLWIPMAGLILCLPFTLTYLMTNNQTLGLLSTMPSGLFFMISIAPVFSLIQSLTGIRTRALAMAVLLSASGVTGGTLGPLFTGFLSDVFGEMFAASGMEASVAITEGLRYAMMLVNIPALLGVTCFYIASRTLDADLAEVRRNNHNGNGEG